MSRFVSALFILFFSSLVFASGSGDSSFSKGGQVFCTSTDPERPLEFYLVNIGNQPNRYTARMRSSRGVIRGLRGQPSLVLEAAYPNGVDVSHSATTIMANAFESGRFELEIYINMRDKTGFFSSTDNQVACPSCEEIPISCNIGQAPVVPAR